MALYYANGRTIFPSNVWNISVTTDGNLAVGTYYFSLQGKSRLGLNELLISNAIQVPSGGKVKITVNSEAFKSGEDWHYYIIGASTTNLESDFVQIAALPSLNPLDQTSILPFPIEFVLDHPDHLALSTTVSSLPTINLLNGMLRGFAANGIIYELDLYDNDSIDDGVLVKIVSGNRWKARSSFSTYIESAFEAGGIRQDIRSVDTSDAIQVVYEPNGSTSVPVKLWLTGDNNTVQQGLRVELSLFIGSYNATQTLDGKAVLTFLGFADLETGDLRINKADGTPMESVGVNQTFNANYPVLAVEDDLLVNEAYVMAVAFRFSSAEWVGLLPEGSNLRAIATFSTASGVFQDLAAFTGDCILAEGSYRRIVPNTGLSIKALSGSGIIQDYSFPLVNSQNVFNLIPDTSNQKIAINGNGDVYFADSEEIPAGSALRAIVSTVRGISKSSNFSASLSVSNNSALQFRVIYPTAIRPGYPDVIAGETQGIFNPPRLIAYVRKQSTGEIKTFTGFIIVPGIDQTFIITDWNAGTLIPSIPTQLDLTFSLFAAPIPTVFRITGGNFEATNYQVAVAFEYDGNQITKIDHKPESGCVAELSGTIEDLFSVRRSWGESVNFDDIVNIEKVDTYPFQTRRVGGTSDLIYYDPLSTAIIDSVKVWLPIWGNPDLPGRWLKQEYDAIKLQGIDISDVAPFDGQTLTYDAINQSLRFRASSGSASIVQPISLENFLLSFWKFEESIGNRRDQKGSNNLIPSSSSVIRVEGKVGYAVAFTNNSYLSITNNNPDLTIGTTESLSISIWIKPFSILDAIVLIKTSEYSLEIAEEKFRWNVATSATATKSITDQQILKTDQWYHVVCFYNSATKLISIRVNNEVSANPVACPSAFDSISTTFYIGGNGTSSFFNGAIDATGIWRRVLQPTEISYLYKDGSGAEIPEPVNATLITGRDVNNAPPSSGMTLQWDGNAWKPGYYDPFPTIDKVWILLLLHFETIGGRPDFTESSTRLLRPELIGNPILSTEQFKFGTKSGYLDGNSYLAYRNNSLFALPRTLTIEGFFRFSKVDATPHLWFIWNDYNDYLAVYLEDEKLKVNNDGTVLISGATTLAIDTWYHVALSRDSSNNLRLFLNGVQEGNTYTTAFSFPSGTPDLILGSRDYIGGTEDYITGYIDEFRVENITEYTENFTALAAPFVNPVGIPKLLTNNARVEIAVDGESVGTRRKINFLPGENVTIAATDVFADEVVELTISSTVNTNGGTGGTVSGDMLQSTYDTDADGIVDNAENLNGQQGSYYRDRANHEGVQPASTISDFAESVDDRVNALLRQGNNISLVYDDVANTLTISATGGSSSTGSSAIAVLDEGATLTTTATSLNFVGAGIEATNTGGSVTINVPGSTGSGSTTLARNQTNYTTAVLPPGAIDAGTVILGKSFHLLKVQTSIPAWIRIYATNAYRNADNRTDSSAAPSDSVKSGIIFEGITSNSQLFIDCRNTFGASLEATPSSSIPIAIANLGSNTATINADFTKLTVEV